MKVGRWTPGYGRASYTELCPRPRRLPMIASQCHRQVIGTSPICERRNEREERPVMQNIDQCFEAALKASIEWTPSFEDIENMAIELAATNGRDWSDCGAYEKELYKDEARRLSGIDTK